MKSRIIFAVMVLTLLPGCQAQTTLPEKTDPTINDMTHRSATKMIDYPKTTQELFQNLKQVLAGHDMLDDAFYTDENLMRVFGGQSVFRDKVPNRTKLYVEGFGNMVPIVGDKSFRHEGMEVFVQRGANSGLNNEFVSSINIRIGFDEPLLSFSRLEVLFGQDWKKLPPDQMYVSDSMPQLTIMQSRTQEGSIHRLIDLDFNSDGYLREALFRVYDSMGSKR